MKTKIRKELKKSVMGGDILGFRNELVKKLSSRVMMFSLEDLWVVFQKAAVESGLDLEHLSEKVYDDGMDFSTQTKKYKSQVIDHFVNETIGYMLKRRGSLRFNFKKDVDIYPLDSVILKPFNARSENISDCGMLIRSGTSFQEGDKLELRVHIKETSDPVQVFGSVVRTEHNIASVFDTGVYIDSIFGHKGGAVFSSVESLYRISQLEHE